MNQFQKNKTLLSVIALSSLGACYDRSTPTEVAKSAAEAIEHKNERVFASTLTPEMAATWANRSSIQELHEALEYKRLRLESPVLLQTAYSQGARIQVYSLGVVERNALQGSKGLFQIETICTLPGTYLENRTIQYKEDDKSKDQLPSQNQSPVADKGQQDQGQQPVIDQAPQAGGQDQASGQQSQGPDKRQQPVVDQGQEYPAQQDQVADQQADQQQQIDQRQYQETFQSNGKADCLISNIYGFMRK